MALWGKNNIGGLKSQTVTGWLSLRLVVIWQYETGWMDGILSITMAENLTSMYALIDSLDVYTARRCIEPRISNLLK